MVRRTIRREMFLMGLKGGFLTQGMSAGQQVGGWLAISGSSFPFASVFSMVSCHRHAAYASGTLISPFWFLQRGAGAKIKLTR